MNEQDEKELLAELLSQSVPGGSTLYNQRQSVLQTEQEIRATLPNLVKSVALLNYIIYHISTDDEIYDAFQPNKLNEAANNVVNGLQLTQRALDTTGFDYMLREHMAVIIDLMKLEHFPKEDLDLLRDIGYRNPRAALAAIIQICKTRRAELTNLLAEVGPMGGLETIQGIIYQQKGRIDLTSDRPMARGRVGRSQPARPSRRWYKGLGQVGGGVAMALGNIALWAGGMGGFLSVGTISPSETVMSVGGGVMAALLGVGDLRNE